MGATLGVWIGLYPFVKLFLGKRIGGFVGDPEQVLNSPLQSAALAVIVAAGIIPISIGAVLFGVDFRRAKYLFASILIFALSIPLSLFASGDPNAVVYVLLVDHVLLCAVLLISTNLDVALVVRRFLQCVCLTLAAAQVVALVDHDYSWGRLMGRSAPNYWGELAMITILTSATMPRLAPKLALIGLSLWMIFATQSRSAMAGLIVGVLTMGILAMRRRKAYRPSWIWLGAAAGGVLAVALGASFIMDDLLKLSDPGRGLNSGFTGRTSEWRDAVDLFVNHPFFGVGYQQHERYITSKIAVHSDYLATLADLGVVGFVGYLLFSLGALARSLLHAWEQPTDANLAMASFLTCFLIVGLVEPTGFHTGNTLSMLMIFCSAWTWRTDESPYLRLERRSFAGVRAPSPRGAKL